MAQLNLKRLLRKNKPVYGAVTEIAAALTVGKMQSYPPLDLAVFDEQGTLLMAPGSSLLDGERTIIRANGQVMGWVTGPEGGRKALASLLERFLASEAEKRELSEEVLDNYRELSLLYNLSERLISAPEPPAIANMALKEAERLVNFTAAWILVLDSEGRILPIAKRGRGAASKQSSEIRDNLVASVLARSEAEIRNEEILYSGDKLLSNPARDDMQSYPTLGDLICAPLKTEQQLLGVILLVGQRPLRYDAHHLKLLNTIALQVGPALEIARLYQVAVEKGRLEQELRQAYEVQASLIPRQTPAIEGWAFAGRWQPARELSGDYYDFIALEDGCVGLVTGDVADKGMPSSLFMVFTRSAVRSSVAYFDSPAASIAQANKLVAQESQDGLFVTLVYGRLDPATGQVIYVNAGHNPALLFECASGKIHELRNTGIPLGILPGSTYRQEEIQLRQGDFLLFYTDGVTEAVNESYEEFGTVRLFELIKKHRKRTAEEMAASIETAVLEFTGDRPLFDDLTFLVVKRIA